MKRELYGVEGTGLSITRDDGQPQPRNDGGPAFPVVRGSYSDEDGAHQVTSDGGMTLRDYFAAKAMVMYSSNPTFDIERDADLCWKAADAMIGARSA